MVCGWWGRVVWEEEWVIDGCFVFSGLSVSMVRVAMAESTWNGEVALFSNNY